MFDSLSLLGQIWWGRAVVGRCLVADPRWARRTYRLCGRHGPCGHIDWAVGLLTKLTKNNEIGSRALSSNKNVSAKISSNTFTNLKLKKHLYSSSLFWCQNLELKSDDRMLVNTAVRLLRKRGFFHLFTTSSLFELGLALPCFSLTTANVDDDPHVHEHQNKMLYFTVHNLWKKHGWRTRWKFVALPSHPLSASHDSLLDRISGFAAH